MPGFPFFSSDSVSSILKELGLRRTNTGSFGVGAIEDSTTPLIDSISPIDNKVLASVRATSPATFDTIVQDLQDTFLKWRLVPAPKRGELVRELAEVLRPKKKALARLISHETGKILAESEGEVQEVIDMADYVVGLSRQLYGQTMHSERAQHRMYEQWHPLGIVGVITAFNFPAAVWAWNGFLAAVCGDVVLWKPSEQAPLTALALNALAREVAERHGFPGLFGLVIGGPEIGKRLAEDSRIALVSATGSCAMGRSVSAAVSKRLGRTLLELGGNNAIIVLEDAEMDLVVPSVVFGAVGTAGQRCTTARRLIVERSIYEPLLARLIGAYQQIPIGNPLEEKTLMGPLINKAGVEAYERAIEISKTEGGEVVYGGNVLSSMPSPLYVQPTIIKAHSTMRIVQEETFAPILYVIAVKDLDEAIKVQNGVPQGLSSAIFTRDLNKAEQFLAVSGSDCGIANVNLGTSGAEIGGAFGGEKETGGGRESGSDVWKQYMRRQTNTINFSQKLPLAQGIKFEVGGGQ